MLEGYLNVGALWIVHKGLLFWGVVRAAFCLIACCLFPQCVQAATPLMGVCQSMACACFQGGYCNEKGLWPVTCAWLSGPWQWQVPMGEMWAQAAPGYRTLGSSSDPQEGEDGTQSFWQQQRWGMCVPGEWRQWVAFGCRALLGSNPWGDQGHRQCLFKGLLVVRSCAHLRSPRWLQWFTPAPGAHTRGALQPENPCVCRERCFYGGPALLVLFSPTMAPCFSCGPRPLPALSWLWSFAPQCPQAVSIQAILVFSRQLTSEAWVLMPRPGMSQAVVWWSVQLLSLCFALFSLAAVLFSEALRLPLCSRWSPGQIAGFPGCRMLSSFTVLSQECWSCPESFFISSISLSLFFLPSYVEGFWPFLEV